MTRQRLKFNPLQATCETVLAPAVAFIQSFSEEIIGEAALMVYPEQFSFYLSEKMWGFQLPREFWLLFLSLKSIAVGWEDVKRRWKVSQQRSARVSRNKMN